MNTDKLAHAFKEVLEDHKGIQIKQLDVMQLTDITDYMIICTATSTQHARTLADKVMRKSKQIGIRPFGAEGEEKGEWILVDLGDVIIHIMIPEVREFYSLEKLWANANSETPSHEN